MPPTSTLPPLRCKEAKLKVLEGGSGGVGGSGWRGTQGPRAGHVLFSVVACYLDTLRLRKFIRLSVLLSVLFRKGIILPQARSQSPPSCVLAGGLSPPPHPPWATSCVRASGQVRTGERAHLPSATLGTPIPIVLEYALNWERGRRFLSAV